MNQMHTLPSKALQQNVAVQSNMASLARDAAEKKKNKKDLQTSHANSKSTLELIKTGTQQFLLLVPKLKSSLNEGFTLFLTLFIHG